MLNDYINRPEIAGEANSGAELTVTEDSQENLASIAASQPTT